MKTSLILRAHILFVVVCNRFLIFLCSENSEKASWKKKNIVDYNDADLEKLFEQWEENDDPLEEDELPEWKRPPPKIDLSKVQGNNVEEMLKMSKKMKTLMMFVSVSGNPTQKETESLSQMWQMSLFNANIEAQSYVVSTNRILFSLKDGSLAWDVKDFLVQQDRCEVVTIEGQDYYGKGHPNNKGEDKGKKDEKKTKQKNEKVKSKQEDKKIKTEEL